ncbi:MAG TPA: hypothetical protein VD996_06390, partial [Chitinophagaceae bacterium]|nr:hypothetical protein [Chitinophagaceae bacterium]
MNQRLWLGVGTLASLFAVFSSFTLFSPSCAQRENPNRTMSLTHSVNSASAAGKLTGSENLD